MSVVIVMKDKQVFYFKKSVNYLPARKELYANLVALNCIRTIGTNLALFRLIVVRSFDILLIWNNGV